MSVKRDKDTSPPSLQTKTVPTIDLNDPEGDWLVAHAVVNACEEWGVFQVVNHGIPADLMQRLQEVGRQFFNLPASEKERVAWSEKYEGYCTKDPSSLKAWNDHVLHKIWPPSCVDYKYWPNNPSDYREVTEEYTRNVRKLTEKIVGYLSKGLGLRCEALIEGLGGDSTEYMLRINHYPPSDSAIGAPKHTDFCGLALLISNDVPGLQVFNDNHWFDVECINSSAVVVLIGDQIMRMSNGRYKNVVHRSTMDKDKTRMTWPVLVNPKSGLVVGPLPELIGDDNPPKFESLTFEEYVRGEVKLRGG